MPSRRVLQLLAAAYVLGVLGLLAVGASGGVCV